MTPSWPFIFNAWPIGIYYCVTNDPESWQLQTTHMRYLMVPVRNLSAAHLRSPTGLGQGVSIQFKLAIASLSSSHSPWHPLAQFSAMSLSISPMRTKPRRTGTSPVLVHPCMVSTLNGAWETRLSVSTYWVNEWIEPGDLRLFQGAFGNYIFMTSKGNATYSVNM